MSATFKPLFDGTQSALKLEPEKAAATFQATSRQAEGLRSEIKIRQFELTVDEPEVLGGQDSGQMDTSRQKPAMRLVTTARGWPAASASAGDSRRVERSAPAT